jgi:hypothetical protein
MIRVSTKLKDVPLSDSHMFKKAPRCVRDAPDPR